MPNIGGQNHTPAPLSKYWGATPPFTPRFLRELHTCSSQTWNFHWFLWQNVGRTREISGQTSHPFWDSTDKDMKRFILSKLPRYVLLISYHIIGAVVMIWTEIFGIFCVQKISLTMLDFEKRKRGRPEESLSHLAPGGGLVSNLRQSEAPLFAP